MCGEYVLRLLFSSLIVIWLKLWRFLPVFQDSHYFHSFWMKTLMCRCFFKPIHREGTIFIKTPKIRKCIVINWINIWKSKKFWLWRFQIYDWCHILNLNQKFYWRQQFDAWLFVILLLRISPLRGGFCHISKIFK